MQQSTSHIGNARREERMPLSALIELRTEYGDEALSADVLDISQSGVGVRAAFVPEVGTRLLCDFRCPPTDDAVHAVGEVAWADWDGPRSGCFGVRFLELDTKSATTIRRYVEPEAEAEPPPPARVANMRIDGVGTPIEADVRLLERDCIVLEQELSFLRLGRGIEVDVPGRGKERGRIASIELRQGPLDTPTLVFGVLLDEKPEPQAHPAQRELPRAREAEREPSAPAAGAEQASHEAPDSVAASVIVSDELLMAEHVGATESEGRAAPAPRADTAVRAARVESAHRREAPQIVRASEAERRGAEEDDADAAALLDRTPPALVWLKRALLSLWVWTRGTLWPWLRARFDKAPAVEATEGEGEVVRPPLAQRMLLPLARASSALGGAWAKLRRARGPKRRTTSPTPRIQRAQQPVRAQRSESAGPAPKNRRLATLGLALVGVGLGVYALAPRSGADRIRVRARAPEPSFETQASAPARVEASPSVTPSSASSEPVVASVAPSSAAASAASSAPVVSSLATDEPSSQGVGSARFGATGVPNGRVFVLRMSGPVKALEGDAREDGFSVRVPGRLALDRASPIATSHRAVARALILNRGEYSELTVEFLPGMRPKYQVVGKDNTLEVTLERL